MYFLLPEPLPGLCSNRIWHRRDAASFFHGSWGTLKRSAPQGSHGRGGSTSVLSSAAVLDLALGFPFSWRRHKPERSIFYDFSFVPASCVYLPGLTSVDRASLLRNRSFPNSGSCHTAGTAPYSWRGKAVLPAKPAESALSKHLPAAILHPDNTQFRYRPR